MKIGFVVSFFDFRNDVRQVIEKIAIQNKVVVFYKINEKEKILRHSIQNVEYRLINEKKQSIWNKLLEYLFLVFKKIPKSKTNYFLMEMFKISNQNLSRTKFIGQFFLLLQKKLPRVFSYDSYLNCLSLTNLTEIRDIDKFIFFTEIADDYLLSRLLRETKDITAYIYSWDHPCKHAKFSKRIEYLCWSDGIKSDTVELQNISPDKINVSGASQLGFLYAYINYESKLFGRTFEFDYIYFGCAIGIKELVQDEIKVIEQLAKITFTERPDLKFVVRPYPVLDQWSLYEGLKSYPNIILDDSFRSKDLSVSNREIYSKFEKISNATAFVHLGTTLGLEACFTETPSFIVDFGYKAKSGLSLYAFIHQYQNQKYLINQSSLNCLCNTNDFAEFLKDDKNKAYLKLNEKVREEFLLKPFDDFCDIITSKAKDSSTKAIF